VSIIICARNEAENLKKYLPLILEQDYKNFQVIVVDDRSEDETEIILNDFATKYPHLVVSQVKNDPKFTHGKKLALLLGIKASSNEWLLMTDADCCPASDKWLSLMQKNFKKDTEIVLGYGGYRKEPGLLNLIIRFETAFNAMIYFSMARAGKPYMGVGRNLAYRKSLFFNNNGFATHTGLSSGDDDLFVNETAHADNTAIEMHPDSFTWSDSEKKLINWIRQKKRHLTTSVRYRSGSKFRLILENLSRVILLISFIVLIAESSLVFYILAAFLLLYLFKAIIFKIVFNRLNERYLFLPSLIIEPLMPVFYSFLHLGNFIERDRIKWK
jgi:cellulose synthase/poly-beta-1,6-N-acetylglucosamine synthase-like glycosyltransferase